MPVAQLNVRLPAEVKRSGDATLARCGVSATDVVRALWRYLGEHEELPSFMRDQAAPVRKVSATSVAAPSKVLAKDDNAHSGQGLALRLARERGLCVPTVQGITYEDLREQAFEEMLEEGAYGV